MRQFIFLLAFSYLKCFSHFLFVGQWQTSHEDGEIQTHVRLVKCAATISCCCPNCSEELHIFPSPICNSSLDSAYFLPEGREDELLNVHSTWSQTFSEKLRPRYGGFVCTQMSCQFMVIPQRQRFPK